MPDQPQTALRCHPEPPCRRQAVRGICFFLLLTFALSLVAQAQTQPKRSRILGIAAVHLYSTNVAGARDFYSKTLNPGGPCLWCEGVPRPPLRVLINKDQMISIDGSPQPTPSNLVAEVSLAVDDLEELVKYLKAQKIKVTATKTPTLHIDAVIKIYSALSITDPEGHLITFVRRPSQVLLAPTPAVAPSNPLHIIHAGFIVRDRAATEHFYKDILGFRPYWHGGMKDDQTDWVSMQVPDGTDWLEFMVNVEPDADQRLRGIMNHIAIGVTDIHAAQKKLLENGVRLTEEPQIGRDGKWQLNLYDPDDTRVELMEFTPVQKPCCSEYTGPHPKP
jgi:catechol 2,3-dioxygenase-like lactoylglutathione lyase family enzyme